MHCCHYRLGWGWDDVDSANQKLGRFITHPSEPNLTEQALSTKYGIVKMYPNSRRVYRAEELKVAKPPDLLRNCLFETLHLGFHRSVHAQLKYWDDPGHYQLALRDQLLLDRDQTTFRNPRVHNENDTVIGSRYQE